MATTLDGNLVCAGGIAAGGNGLKSVVSYDLDTPPVASSPLAAAATGPPAIAIALPPLPSGLLSHMEEAAAYDQWADAVQAQVDAAGADAAGRRQAIENKCAADLGAASDRRRQTKAAAAQQRAALLDAETAQHQQTARNESRRHERAKAAEARRHAAAMADEAERHRAAAAHIDVEHRDTSETHATRHALHIFKLESDRDQQLAALPKIASLDDQIQRARKRARDFRQLHILQGGSIRGRANWASTDAKGVDDQKLFVVVEDSDEYQTVAQQFSRTFPEQNHREKLATRRSRTPEDIVLENFEKV
eukprot:gene19211-6401_t